MRTFNPIFNTNYLMAILNKRKSYSKKFQHFIAADSGLNIEF